MPCPATEYEIKHGFSGYLEVCEECCEANFESYPWGCVLHYYDCSRVKNLQRQLLAEIAEKKRLKEFSKRAGLGKVYTNTQKTIAIGTHDTDPTKLFSENSEDINTIYVGDDYGFATVADQKFAYWKAYWEEILETLKKLGEEDLTYQVLMKPGILLIRGYSIWGALAPLDLDLAYTSEKHNFMRKVREGWSLFKQDIRDEMHLVDFSSEAAFDWSRIKPDEFEELCVDILSSFESIQDCMRTGGSGDEGRDIKARERIKTIGAFELRDWCVQCKHFQSRPISRKDIDDLNTLHTRFKFDVFCVMTSSKLSPGAMILLEKYEKQAAFGIKIMDKQFLERRIKEIPELSKRFLPLK